MALLLCPTWSVLVQRLYKSIESPYFKQTDILYDMIISLKYSPYWLISAPYRFNRLWFTLNRLLTITWIEICFDGDSSSIDCPTYFANLLMLQYVPYSMSINWFQAAHFYRQILKNKWKMIFIETFFVDVKLSRAVRQPFRSCKSCNMDFTP